MSRLEEQNCAHDYQTSIQKTRLVYTDKNISSMR